jgi:hypothetical protein
MMDRGLKKSTKIQRRASGTSGGSGRVAGARAIGALVSPVRQELVDTVEALGGEATIAEVAAQLGRPADGLYYHVRPLVKAGLLVRRVHPDGDRFATPAARGRRLAIEYAPGDPASAAALRRVVASMLRIARRDFDAGLRRPGVVANGPRRALWAARSKGWVSAAELAELNALLARAAALLRKPRGRGRDQLVSLCFVLAPIAARAPRRSGGGGPRRTS